MTWQERPRPEDQAVGATAEHLTTTYSNVRWTR